MNLGPGHRTMVSPTSPLACAPAGELRSPQARYFKPAFKAKNHLLWRLGSWNVRSLLDAEGPVETARQGRDTVDGEDRRIDLVIRELARYNIKVAALQETKWMGNGVYQVGSSTVLASGRPVPGPGEPLQRGEGVAIVLCGPAVGAWQEAGETWRAWSARIISTKIQLRKNKKKADTLHILSCYAPTRAASRAEKNKFYGDLQQALAAIPPDEMYVMMGDFNARVGSRLDDGDPWGHVRGPHGYGECNDAGRELLAFLSNNEAVICNTWFEKKNIHKQTWQHPKSKRWHCIDFAIMRRRDRRRCLNASVLRGAECHTDHQLLSVCLRVHEFRSYRGPKTLRKRFDVTALVCRKKNHPEAEDENERMRQTRTIFQHAVVETAQSRWPPMGSVEEKWQTVRGALTEAAESVLGIEKRHHPDWFRESADALEPVLQHRNNLYMKWLATGGPVDLQRFRQARGDARRAVRAAKNSWFQAMADEAQKGRFGGKEVWRCIRALQAGRRGLRPTRCTSIRNDEGNICDSKVSKYQQWLRHFSRVLNIRSQFDAEEVEKVRQRPVRPVLGEKPNEHDITAALRKLKCGKAGGNSNILPEMVKAACCREEFMALLIDLIHTAWTDGKVPKDWVDAILIPIPKKGDLSKCDNWRGIALLEVVGKLMARVLQDRLQQLSEEELPETQCGFRKGRGCTDMMFTLRQLMEKSVEHRTKQFTIFVDLRKAYDSVPRTALWRALLKLGVPEEMMKLIRSFHDNMTARVYIDGELLEEEISVLNGLRQGCTMAPTLFNLYSCLVMERWMEQVRHLEGVGICLRYKLDGKLFRRSTRASEQAYVTDCQFADDAAILASTRHGAEQAIMAYIDVAAKFGLTVSLPKTKLLVTGHGVTEAERAPIAVGGDHIDCVDEFPYLGSAVMSCGRIEAEVDRRIAGASRAFGALRHGVFGDKNLTTITKRKVYQACVLPVLLYGSECWTPLRRHLNRLNAFHHRCIRTILHITNKQQWEQHITSQTIRERWGDTETVADKIRKRRLEWLGHIARMPEHRIPKLAFFGWLPHPRPPGGPRKRWKDQIRADLKVAGISESVWHEEALSRAEWRANYRLGLEPDLQSQPHQSAQSPIAVRCHACGRSFRREGDKKRHKCILERSKPVSEQHGAVQCTRCQRWFRSRGGFSVHNCRPTAP